MVEEKMKYLSLCYFRNRKKKINLKRGSNGWVYIN